MRASGARAGLDLRLPLLVAGVGASLAAAVTLVSALDLARQPVSQPQGLHAASPAPAMASRARRSQIASAYGRVPLSFERNHGQADRRVEFLSRGAGYSLLLTRSGPTLTLAKQGKEGGAARSARVGIEFVGGQTVAPSASGRLAGRVNYLVGDRSRWRTNVETFSQVAYPSVWSGIDVVFHGRQRALEYDFRLRPGADPSKIATRFSGARGLSLDRRGNLVIALRGGRVRQLAPVAYQTVAGERRAVASSYELGPGNRVGIRVGAYDRRRALVIDPVVSYATYLGGDSEDRGQGIAVDSSGNAYVSGNTTSTDFPTTPGALDTSLGGSDVFVTKLNATGSALTYSTYLGGSGGENFLFGRAALAIDSGGNAYVTGSTSSTDFPTTSGAFDTTLNPGDDSLASAGPRDVFVTKLNATGSALVYSTYLGGDGSLEGGNGIAVGSGDVAYVTGGTSSSDFPTTSGAFDTSQANPTGGGGTSNDAFVTALNATGTALVYSTYLGGGNVDDGEDIAVDSSGNAYLGGRTGSSDFPTTPGAFDTTLAGSGDAFVTKLNATGSALGYSTYLGGTGAVDDTVHGIALDSSTNAYLTGFTRSTDFPTTAGAFDTSLAGSNDDAFVTKLNADGSTLGYSTFLGGDGGDTGRAIALDSSANAYVTGTTGSTDLSTAGCPHNNGTGDIFVAKLNAAGSALGYYTYLGTFGTDSGDDIAVDSTGHAYLTGSTAPNRNFTSPFPTTPGAFDTTDNPGGDAFVAKFDSNPSRLCTTSTTVSCTPDSVAVGSPTTCTATVDDTDPGSAEAPTGNVSLASTGQGAFDPGASCTLAPTGFSGFGLASCSVSYTPSAVGTGTHTISGTYPGDATHEPSSSGANSASVTVTDQGGQPSDIVPGGGSSGGTGGGGSAPGRPPGAPGSGAPGGRAGQRCLPRRLRVSRRRIGPARLGASVRALQSRYFVVSRSKRALRFCVTGGGRFLVVSRRGRITLAATTARRHGTTRIKPGRRIRRLRGTRRVARGVFAGRRGRGRIVYGLRRGRVRYLAVVSSGQLKKPRTFARRLRALRLR
jgi:Beta-propeller repeat